MSELSLEADMPAEPQHGFVPEAENRNFCLALMYLSLARLSELHRAAHRYRPNEPWPLPNTDSLKTLGLRRFEVFYHSDTAGCRSQSPRWR